METRTITYDNAPHYRILEKLGEGGMGVVYKAQDTRLDRTVALKFLSPRLEADEIQKGRFIHEAKAASALDHPNICTIYEIAHSAEGQLFIAMAYYPGETLRQRIKRGPLPLREAVDIGVQLAQGLSAAHAKGIVHRDLKPGNIVLTEEGIAKILDFGLAKLEGVTQITTSGTIMGTVEYMSPEQAQGRHVDARSDVWSLGVVLYEMLTGRPPFEGTNPAGTLHSILYDEPQPVARLRPDVPPEVEQIVSQCLQKDPHSRYSSAAELHEALVECQPRSSAVRTETLFQRIRRPRWAVPLLLLILALCLGAGWLIHRSARARWAREMALPEIERLVGKAKYVAAFDLARQAEPYIAGDPLLKRLRPWMSAEISVTTNPPGADVSLKDYKDPGGAWRHVGRSPLEKLMIPAGSLRWKVEKKGYYTTEICTHNWFWSSLNLTLDEQGKVPIGMVRVSWLKDTWITDMLSLPGLDHIKPVPLADYWMDRYEVTNRQFKEFVEQGGYQKREYWKQPFVENGRTLRWEEVMARFKDRTGRPGPATWELGQHPRGQEDYPVGGVSWYEAAAYAEYAGKSLPTIFHWVWAACTPMGDSIVPLSNFGHSGPAPVGSHNGMSPWGTYDMAGNVKEWCWTATGAAKRYVLGGSWGEPFYMFTDPDARSPFDRSPNLGFRCVKYPTPPPVTVMSSVTPPIRNYDKETPVSEQVFRVYRSLFSYDKTSLNGRVESSADDEEGWRKERVSFDAAYSKDRVTAFLFLPKKFHAPYQAVVYFPGSNAITNSSSEDLEVEPYDFIVKSGRAVMYPIYRGTYERKDDLKSDYPDMTNSYRDHVICWSKDLGRSIDYLETRPEIDRDKIAYYGVSWGAALGCVLPALESRLKASVLFLGGFYQQSALPEADQINFAPRVKVPTLMLNGRYDFFLPAETSQKPMFRLLGTPKEHKQYKVYEGGHMIPRHEWYKETLDWLDRYLGPVK